MALALSGLLLSATTPTARAEWGSIEGRFVAEEDFLVPVKIPPGAIPEESTDCFRSKIYPPVNTASVSGTSVTGISIATTRSP